MRSKKYGLKAIAALVSSAMLFSAVGLFPLNSSAICCRKDGFDKSRYTLTGNMAEDVAIIAKSQKGRWCDDFGYSGVDRGAWCDEFVADCIENAGADSSIVGHGGTVADFESVMRKKGAYDVSNPQVGDLIFFTKSHVEIVTKVENGVVYCAGGNNAAPGSKYKSPGCCAGERKASTVGTTRLFLRPAYTPPPPPTKPSPQWATLSVNSTQLPVNDLLEFSATSDDANVFYLNIDKDFERLYCEKMTDGKYSIKLSEPGYYTACVTAWNEGGWVDSEYIGFTVVAPPPSASLMTENYITNYNVNDTVTFLASSDNAEVCFLNIDKDNKRLYCEEMTDGKYSIKLSEPGYYSSVSVLKAQCLNTHHDVILRITKVDYA